MARRTPESLLEQGRRAYGEYPRKYAWQLFRNALKACGRDGDARQQAEIHVALAKVERDLKRNEAALSHYRSAAELYRRLNNPVMLAHAVRHIADILQGTGRHGEAGPFAVEAIAIYRSQQSPVRLHLANALRVAALVMEQEQAQDEALRFWAEAKGLYQQEGVDAGVAESELHMASIGFPCGNSRAIGQGPAR
jgi:tetratricopeptide (TPR) repeat protein